MAYDGGTSPTELLWLLDSLQPISTRLIESPLLSTLKSSNLSFFATTTCPALDPSRLTPFHTRYSHPPL